MTEILRGLSELPPLGRWLAELAMAATIFGRGLVGGDRMREAVRRIRRSHLAGRFRRRRRLVGDTNGRDDHSRARAAGQRFASFEGLHGGGTADGAFEAACVRRHDPSCDS